MADSNSSNVSVVAIIAILILVAAVLYFVFMRGGANDAEMQIDIGMENTTWVQPGTAAAPL